LTVSELRALQRGNNLRKAAARENAAFAGFCAGTAFALAWNGKLGTFQDFYHVPETVEPAPEYTSQDYIARYESWQ
jgi:hypothetical protein